MRVSPPFVVYGVAGCVMPTELPIQPSDWSSLDPIGVCLGLLTFLVLVGIPLLIHHHRKDMAATRTEFINSIDKISARYEEERRRKDGECAAERKAVYEKFEALFREQRPRRSR